MDILSYFIEFLSFLKLVMKEKKNNTISYMTSLHVNFTNHFCACLMMSALGLNCPRRLNHFKDKFRRHFESYTRGMSGHKSSVLSTTKILLNFGLREIVFQRQAAGSQCRKELKVEARQSLINVKSSAVLRQRSAEDHLSRAKVAHHRPHLTNQR